MPNAVRISDACSSGRPRSFPYDTLCTLTIMKTRPSRHHEDTRYQRRGSARASLKVAFTGLGTAWADTPTAALEARAAVG